MTSAKFTDFLTPGHCHKSADFVPFVCFLGTPLPHSLRTSYMEAPQNETPFLPDGVDVPAAKRQPRVAAVRVPRDGGVDAGGGGAPRLRRHGAEQGLAPVAPGQARVIARCSGRGLPYMMSAKFSDFLTPFPPPPCLQIHATSLTKVAHYVCF